MIVCVPVNVLYLTHALIDKPPVNASPIVVEFVMVIDVGVNDYILVQSFEFVPTTSYASNTLL